MNDMHACLSDLSNVPQSYGATRHQIEFPGGRPHHLRPHWKHPPPSKPIRPLILLIPRPPIWTPRSVGWKHLTLVSSRIGYLPAVVDTLSPDLPTLANTHAQYVMSSSYTTTTLNQQDGPRSNRAETTHYTRRRMWLSTTQKWFQRPG